MFSFFSVLNKLTLFLCNVGLVNGELRGLSNNGLRHVLRGVASGACGNILLNYTMATVVRSSSTMAIVTINFMGSKVVRLSETVNIVVNTGINAATAT